MIKGKQILDASIPQSKLNITPDSIVNNNSVTNKKYVDDKAVNALEFNKLGLNLQALQNASTSGGFYLATELAIQRVPRSQVKVNVNGVNANIGTTATDWAFFSPDEGITKRNGEDAKIGDKLYWNTGAPFQLETDDEIDFSFLVNAQEEESALLLEEAGTIYGTFFESNTLSLKTTLNQGEFSFLHFAEENVNIKVSNIGPDPGQFQFDTDSVGNGPLTWDPTTEVGVSKEFSLGGNTYNITWDGYGSLLATIEKLVVFTGTQVAYLKASNAEANDQFGYSVSINGDRAIVGARREEAGAGAAYVFERDGSGNWNEVAYLKASNADANDQFGYSVSISGDRAIVGANQEDSNGTGPTDNSLLSAGAAYVFERNGSGNWIQVAYLKASNVEANDQFGFSASISGDRAIVGAFTEDSNGTGPTDNSASAAGAAYVFERDGSGNWNEVVYLKASNAEADDQFGYSVSISGDRALIGASREDSNGTGPGDNSASAAGAAYVFERDGSGNWNEVAYLKASNAEANDQFGVSVSISGDRAIVGASQEDSNGTGPGDNSEAGSGAAYVFERDGSGNWNEVAYLKASNAETIDQFGFSVSISGDRAIVGAFIEDSNGTGPTDNSAAAAGAAYVFERNGSGNWIQIAYLKASNAEANDQFGFSVSISGHRALIGATQEDSNGTGPTDNSAAAAGAAYIFE